MTSPLIKGRGRVQRHLHEILHAGFSDFEVPEDEIEAQKIRRARVLEDYAARPSSEGTLGTNLAMLATEFELDQLEVDIFRLLLVYERDTRHESFCDKLMNAVGHFTQGIGMLLGADPEEVHRRVVPTSKMVELGLISIHHGRQDLVGDRAGYFKVPEIIRTSMFRPTPKGPFAIRGMLVGNPACASHSLADFDHIGEDGHLICSLMKGALKDRARGINVLLFGAPGTGKTEFCKTVADSLGVPLFTIGEVDDEGREPSRSDRLTHLKLAQGYLGKNGNAILLLDEMDDVAQSNDLPFGGNRGNDGSKVFMNRLLETNRLPVFWTANSIRSFEKSFLSRMSLAVEFKAPPETIRQKLWQKALSGSGVQSNETDLIRLAEIPNVPARVIWNSCQVAVFAGGGTDVISRATKGVMTAMGHDVPESHDNDNARADYSLDLVNANEDLQSLTDALTRASSKAISLCLYGPPGSGKSAFLRHLAKAMAMKAVQKRASDLLSRYVGESEKQIASAFREAAEEGTFLIFDEADSLLLDRSSARARWEISQVNEMLTWMEVHKFPFACTTNLMDRLDTASLRRFTLKIGFGYLKPDQVRLAFERYFGTPCPNGLDDFDTLTPADFDLVRRKARILGLADNPNALLRLFSEECQAKPHVLRRIGFVRA